MAEVVENSPDLWKNLLPRPKPDGHKYDRGHTAILGSDQFTGATRLAAEACSRIGSGLVSVLSEHQAQLYRTVLPPDVMVTAGPLIQLKRLTTLLAGPGGCSDAQALAVLQSKADLSLVLDADAIRLWPELNGRSAILTPHEGEFARYFPMIEGAAADRARAAAKQSGMVLTLKGAETLIAAPDGRCAVNKVASPYLAKAGTGDVLAGLLAGMRAQGMPAFEAACAGVWIHGAASERIGPGLLPQDLSNEIAPLLRDRLS